MLKINTADGAKRMVPTPDHPQHAYVIERWNAAAKAWEPTGEVVSWANHTR